DAIIEALTDKVAIWAADAFRRVPVPCYCPRWERNPDAPDIAEFVAWLPDIVRDASLAGHVRSQARLRSVWEMDDSDSHPSTTTALRVVQAHVHGYSPTATRDRGTIEVHVPDRPVIWQAKAGNVLWLAVGALPTAMIEAVGGEVVEVTGRPRTLH